MPKAAANPVTAPPTDVLPLVQATRPRIMSLDILRAIVVGLMIYMDHPLIAAATPWWLLHPAWNGFHLADTIAPAFMFAVGMSLAFSARKLTDENYDQVTKQFVKRVLILFAIGVALGFYKYDVSYFRISLVEPFRMLRVMGVLQRIAIGSWVAWFFIRKDWKWTLSAAAILLAIHTVLILYVHAPGVIPGAWTANPAGPGSVAVLEHTSLAGWVDKTLWGLHHTYEASGFDPDGTLGLLSVSAQILLGLTLGKFVVGDHGSGKIVRPTIALGIVGIIAGVVLGQIGLPVNKYIWTASFVLVSSGIATLAFGLLYWWLDMKGKTKGWRWLVPLGRNALLMFIGENAFAATTGLIRLDWHGHVTTLAALIARAMTKVMSPTAATLLFSALELGGFLLLAEFLYRRKLFFKF